MNEITPDKLGGLQTGETTLGVRLPTTETNQRSLTKIQQSPMENGMKSEGNGIHCETNISLNSVTENHQNQVSFCRLSGRRACSVAYSS